MSEVAGSGLPNLSFTNFTGLNDTRAAFRRDQTLQFSDGMFYSYNRHNLRWGADFRLIQTETHSTQNARGNFTFTGARTAAIDNGTPAQGTGYDFADFLMGLQFVTVWSRRFCGPSACSCVPLRSDECRNGFAHGDRG